MKTTPEEKEADAEEIREAAWQLANGIETRRIFYTGIAQVCGLIAAVLKSVSILLGLLAGAAIFSTGFAPEFAWNAVGAGLAAGAVACTALLTATGVSDIHTRGRMSATEWEALHLEAGRIWSKIPRVWTDDVERAVLQKRVRQIGQKDRLLVASWTASPAGAITGWLGCWKRAKEQVAKNVQLRIEDNGTREGNNTGGVK